MAGAEDKGSVQKNGSSPGRPSGSAAKPGNWGPLRAVFYGLAIFIGSQIAAGAGLYAVSLVFGGADYKSFYSNNVIAVNFLSSLLLGGFMAVRAVPAE